MSTLPKLQGSQKGHRKWLQPHVVKLLETERPHGPVADRGETGAEVRPGRAATEPCSVTGAVHRIPR